MKDTVFRFEVQIEGDRQSALGRNQVKAWCSMPGIAM